MRLNLGPSFQYFHVDSVGNKDHYLNQLIDDQDHGSIYKPKSFLGVDARLDIDSRNNPVLPSRGAVINVGIRQLFGISNDSRNVTQANVDLRIFMSLAPQPGYVLATRFGWAKNFGDFEFPQAQYLGETDNLRGFRKQRFAGRSMLFNNTELRIKIADFNTYLFPGSFGILLFNDIGRVYVDNESSKKWHDGYGGGIWFSPIQRIVASLTLAHSDEQAIYPRITLGFQF
jgi:outer membrane protein assembly factor BamA